MIFLDSHSFHELQQDLCSGVMLHANQQRVKKGKEILDPLGKWEKKMIELIGHDQLRSICQKIQQHLREEFLSTQLGLLRVSSLKVMPRVVGSELVEAKTICRYRKR